MTRDEFRKLSAVAALWIPHDEAMLTLRSPERLDVRLLLNADDVVPNAEDDVSVAAEADVARLMTDEEARVCGFGDGVRVPVRVTNGTGGLLTFLARRPQTYGDDILQKIQPLADYISAVLRHEDAVRRMSQDDRANDAQDAWQQVKSCEAPGPHAHAAVRPTPQVRSGHSQYVTFVVTAFIPHSASESISHLSMPHRSSRPPASPA